MFLLRQPGFIQQLAADLQDLLIQRVRAHSGGNGFRFVAQVIELRTQGLGGFGEVVDNQLVLLSALERGVSLVERIERGLEHLNGFGLIGRRFRRLSLLQFLGYLFCVGDGRCERPHTEAPGHQKSDNQAHVSLPL